MNLKYDWSKEKNITLFLIKIYYNTQNVLKTINKDIKYADEFLTDIEEYFMYLKNENYNLDIIENKLKELLYIKVTAENTHTNLINCNGYISINEDIKIDNNLTKEENRRLILYEGLTKYLLNYQNEKINEFNNMYHDNDSIKVLNDGWELLTDTLSQELAQRITYKLANKKIPVKENVYKNLLLAFGTTLSGVGSIKDYSDKKIMDDLLKKALTGNLTDQIISEYIYKGNEDMLYTILYNMGILRRTTGLESAKIYMDTINKCYKLSNFDDDIYEDIEVVKKHIVKK